MELLRDPIWQFVGVFISFITVFITVWFSNRNHIKRLEYEILAKTPLININPDSEKARIKVLFDDVPIQGAEFILVKISNPGLMPIKPNDFISPLNICFDKEVNILNFQLVDLVPSDLKVSVLLNNKSDIQITPLLLNPKDFFVLKVITSSSSEISVQGRIVGVNKILEKQNKKYSWRIAVTTFIWIMAIAFIYWIFSGFSESENLFKIAALALTIFFGQGVLPRLFDWINRA